MLTILCTVLLLLTGFLLMFIVLLQRGRGGGLAGAFGGLGGQSAFGTKAGDVFTRITIVLAVIWVALSGITGYAMRYESEKTSFKGSRKQSDSPEVSPAGDSETKGRKPKAVRTGTFPDDKKKNVKPDSGDRKKPKKSGKTGDESDPQ